MDTLVVTGTIIIGFAGIILSAVFLRTIMSTNSAPSTTKRPATQDVTRVPVESPSTEAFSSVAALLFLNRPPEVARFLNNPLELTEEAQKREFEEDLAASTKRHHRS